MRISELYGHLKDNEVLVGVQGGIVRINRLVDTSGLNVKRAPSGADLDYCPLVLMLWHKEWAQLLLHGAGLVQSLEYVC